MRPSRTAEEKKKKKKKKKPKVGDPISSPRIPRFDRSIDRPLFSARARSIAHEYSCPRRDLCRTSSSPNEAGPRSGERWTVVVLFPRSRQFLVPSSSPPHIDSPYSPPPPRATATFLRGLLINGESINGGLRGIPKKSQRGRREGMDPPGSCNEEISFFFLKKWKCDCNFRFDCSLNSLARKEIKIRLLVRLFRDDE